MYYLNSESAFLIIYLIVNHKNIWPSRCIKRVDQNVKTGISSV